jgi:Calcineurin-like phosphoesterase
MKHYLIVPGICSFVLAFAGCATQPGHLATDLPGRYVSLTRPIIAVGDTQEHNATGFPLHQEDGAVDSYVEVAQRPPEQPLFGRRLLEFAIQKHPDLPLVHLGDVVDMSCQSEWRRMRKIFDTGEQPKVVLPGNHDGLLFGIFNHDLITDYLKGEVMEWQRGCRESSETDEIEPDSEGRGPALNKRMFIQKYIEFLSAGPNSYIGFTSTKKVQGLKDIQLTWINPDPDGFVEKLDANLVFGRNYASSYIVQKLRLPPAPEAGRRVTMIGIDTSQLNVAIGVLNMLSGGSPGDTGRILDDEAKVIKRYVEEALQAGEIVIFAGHHSWRQLDQGSKNRLAKIMESVDNPLVYISAHTHEGSWAMHRLGNRSLLELNVSSLSDWPIAYR